jgi:two-component system sensor histidine kinase KdpD
MACWGLEVGRVTRSYRRPLDAAPVSGEAATHTDQKGRYRIFLGMAAGVGKTYRMLQEGRAEADAGHDTVIGYLEPHDRPETTAQARGLELMRRREVTYRDKTVEEMDLPGILARGPELALIDELAHTNVRGVEHEKRFQDIADVLDAGIDVFSTVNVQHLESLNDQVCELTGVAVRETFPDSVLATADEVVLIDVTPEALIERLRAGKVYPGQNVQSALSNFFRIENLAALRELALRQVAEQVESRRLIIETQEPVSRREDLVEADVPKAVGERILALVRPRRSSQRLVRRAWRSAQRLGTDLDLLWVKRPQERMTERKATQLGALRRLASVLGATLLVEESDDIVAAAAEVVRTRGTTYIFVGESEPPRWLNRFREPLPQRLMRATPAGVDVRIVAYRGLPNDLDEET